MRGEWFAAIRLTFFGEQDPRKAKTRLGGGLTFRPRPEKFVGLQLRISLKSASKSSRNSISANGGVCAGFQPFPRRFDPSNRRRGHVFYQHYPLTYAPAAPSCSRTGGKPLSTGTTAPEECFWRTPPAGGVKSPAPPSIFSTRSCSNSPILGTGVASPLMRGLPRPPDASSAPWGIAYPILRRRACLHGLTASSASGSGLRAWRHMGDDMACHTHQQRLRFPPAC